MTASSGSGRLSDFQGTILRAFASRRTAFFLTGGAVLAGWVLRHRRTDDLVLFTTEAEAMLQADRLARAVAADIGATVEPIQTTPDCRRYALHRGEETMVVDFIRERVPQLHAKVVRDGITMDATEEIVANKICALLRRAELRDVVDLYCLEAAGLPIERFVADARQKDAGVTPAALAWVLSELAVPDTVPGDVDPEALRAFVRDLEARMRRQAMPERS